MGRLDPESRHGFPEPQAGGFDPAPHRAIIDRQLLSLTGDEEVQFEATGKYPWGESDRVRLEFQCLRIEEGGVGWGDAHKEHYQIIKDKLGIDPRVIVTIGVDPKGRTALNLHRTFPDAKIIVIEMDANKVDSSTEVIKKEAPGQIESGKIQLITGDAVHVLRNLPEKPDIVDAQLVFGHTRYSEEDPIFWDREQNGPFTNIPTLSNEIVEVLPQGALVVIRDLAMGRWGAEGSEAGFVNGFIENARETGWRRAKKYTWDSVDDFIQTMREIFEGLGLTFRGDLTHVFQVPPSKAGEKGSVFCEYMGPAVYDGLMNNFRVHKKALKTAAGQKKTILEQIVAGLQAAIEPTRQAAIRYVNACRSEDVIMHTPPLAGIVFQKI